jgi:hypothetical protein
MSTTRKMLLHNRYRRRDQEKFIYADPTVMPTKAGGVRVATFIDHTGRHNGAS